MNLTDVYFGKLKKKLFKILKSAKFSKLTAKFKGYFTVKQCFKMLHFQNH